MVAIVIMNKYIGHKNLFLILAAAATGSAIEQYLKDRRRICVRRTECESNIDENTFLKRSIVANSCVDTYVKSGMTVSVGTGTIGLIAIGRIGEKLKNKEILDVTIVPCSEDLKKKCISLGIPVSSLSDVLAIDIAISGADEIDPSLNMIKGKTGSLLREKMIEQAAKSVILLLDDTKLTRKLGPGAPLAVEVIPYSHQHIRKKIESLPSLSGCRAILRRGNINNNKSDGMDVSVTDNGNYIIDIFFNDPIKNIEKVANDLNSIVGVVEHGLFMRNPDTLMIADNKAVHTLEKLDNDFWFDLVIPKSPLDREALDNRDPIINNINNKDN